MLEFYNKVEKELKKDDRLWSKDKKPELLKSELIKLITKNDEKLLTLLFAEKEIAKRFFKKIGEITIFEKDNFIKLVTMNSFLPNSFTAFENKIGLEKNGELFIKNKDVSLVFPHKDCILEGGQTKEEQKREEIFYNTIFAPDEIDRLREPKVLTNAKRITKDGEEDVTQISNKDNLIIKGNNLMALYSLLPSYRGKIKLIYIDPPYNTQNDSFKYNDNFNHSTWLIFMKNRLEIAKQLLSNDGVIFVQCDDNEQAYLKVLMDEIFGVDNFINVISARMKNIAGASGGGEDKRLKKNIEFINIFAKNYDSSKLEKAYEYTEIWDLVQSYKQEKISWKYTSVIVDYGKKIYLKSTKDGNGNEIKIYNRTNPIFKSISQLAKDQKKSQKEIYYKYIDKIFTTAMPQSSIRTRVLKTIENETFDFISIEYVPISGKNKGKLYEQFYKGNKLRLLTWLKDVVEEKNNKIYKKDLQGTFWDGFNLNNLSKEGDTVFESGKKPEELIKKVLTISTHNNDIVLDYHLGSGTTAAVAHKMGRQYIGIEQMDYIETIAVERLKKVIGSEKMEPNSLVKELKYDAGGISKSVDWQGGGEFVYVELLEWNKKYIDLLEAATTDIEIEKIKKKIEKEKFYKYQIDLTKFDEEEFSELSIDNKKQVLLDILDLNHLYVNLDSMEDEQFKVSKKDKELTKNFYNTGELI